MLHVDLHQPSEVTSSTHVGASYDARDFATLRVSDASNNEVTLFLTHDNAYPVLEALAKQTEKVLDFLYPNDVVLDESTEGNKK